VFLYSAQPLEAMRVDANCVCSWASAVSPRASTSQPLMICRSISSLISVLVEQTTKCCVKVRLSWALVFHKDIQVNSGLYWLENCVTLAYVQRATVHTTA